MKNLHQADVVQSHKRVAHSTNIDSILASYLENYANLSKSVGDDAIEKSKLDFAAGAFIARATEELSLEDLRVLLGKRLGEVNEKIVSSINRNYSSFMDISTVLQKSEVQIENLRHPIELISNKLKAIQAKVEEFEAKSRFVRNNHRLSSALADAATHLKSLGALVAKCGAILVEDNSIKHDPLCPVDQGTKNCYNFPRQTASELTDDPLLEFDCTENIRIELSNKIAATSVSVLPSNSENTDQLLIHCTLPRSSQQFLDFAYNLRYGFDSLVRFQKRIGDLEGFPEFRPSSSTSTMNAAPHNAAALHAQFMEAIDTLQRYIGKITLHASRLIVKRLQHVLPLFGGERKADNQHASSLQECLQNLAHALVLLLGTTNANTLLYRLLEVRLINPFLEDVFSPRRVDQGSKGSFRGLKDCLQTVLDSIPSLQRTNSEANGTTKAQHEIELGVKAALHALLPIPGLWCHIAALWQSLMSHLTKNYPAIASPVLTHVFAQNYHAISIFQKDLCTSLATLQSPALLLSPILENEEQVAGSPFDKFCEVATSLSEYESKLVSHMVESGAVPEIEVNTLLSGTEVWKALETVRRYRLVASVLFSNEAKTLANLFQTNFTVFASLRSQKLRNSYSKSLESPLLSSTSEATSASRRVYWNLPEAMALPDSLSHNTRLAAIVNGIAASSRSEMFACVPQYLVTLDTGASGASTSTSTADKTNSTTIQFQRIFRALPAKFAPALYLPQSAAVLEAIQSIWLPPEALPPLFSSSLTTCLGLLGRYTTWLTSGFAILSYLHKLTSLNAQFGRHEANAVSTPAYPLPTPAPFPHNHIRYAPTDSHIQHLLDQHAPALAKRNISSRDGGPVTPKPATPVATTPRETVATPSSAPSTGNVASASTEGSVTELLCWIHAAGSPSDALRLMLYVIADAWQVAQLSGTLLGHIILQRTLCKADLEMEANELLSGRQKDTLKQLFLPLLSALYSLFNVAAAYLLGAVELMSNTLSGPTSTISSIPGALRLRYRAAKSQDHASVPSSYISLIQTAFHEYLLRIEKPLLSVTLHPSLCNPPQLTGSRLSAAPPPLVQTLVGNAVVLLLQKLRESYTTTLQSTKAQEESLRWLQKTPAGSGSGTLGLEIGATDRDRTMIQFMVDLAALGAAFGSDIPPLDVKDKADDTQDRDEEVANVQLNPASDVLGVIWSSDTKTLVPGKIMNNISHALSQEYESVLNVVRPSSGVPAMESNATEAAEASLTPNA